MGVLQKLTALPVLRPMVIYGKENDRFIRNSQGNGLSTDHRTYLPKAVGWLWTGDGKLNYK